MGADVVTTEHKNNATEEKKQANKFRGVSIFFIVVAVVVLVFLLF